MRLTPRLAALIPLLALLTGACGIALAPIFVRLSELPPVTTAFYRLALATPLLFLLQAVLERRQAAPTASDRRWLWLAGLAFAGDLGVWHVSILYTSVANATLLANLAPVVVATVAWLWLGERLGRAFPLGLVLALAGAALLVEASLGLDRRHLIGDGLGALTALFYGAYLLAIKLARRRLSTWQVMAWSTLAGALVLLPVAWALEGLGLPASLEGWLVLTALAGLSHVGGQGLIAYAMAHLPASFSSVALLLQPAVAAGLAWWLFGEALGPWQGLGGLAIVAGILIARRSSRQPPSTRRGAALKIPSRPL